MYEDWMLGANTSILDKDTGLRVDKPGGTRYLCFMKIPQPLVKVVQKKEDFYIEFTDEEMQALDFKPGDKFEVEAGDESIILRKMVPVDINLGDFDKDTLVFLIEESISEQKPVDDVIREYVEKYLKEKTNEA